MRVIWKPLALLFITDRFIPKRFDGFNLGPIILIRPGFKNDRGLLEHELVHVRQFYRTFGLFGLLHLFSPKHRLEYELEAYCVSVRYGGPQSADFFGMMIATKYNLDITPQEATERLNRCYWRLD